MLDFGSYDVLMFDCYGTLIDWEAGILGALRPVLQNHQIRITDNDILDLYAQLESEAEACDYCNYKDIQRRVIQGIGEETGFEPTSEDLLALEQSIGDWQPFPDTIEALQVLSKHYKLAILSNIDDDLIKKSVDLLEVDFDWVITAEQVKSYKPSLNNFERAIEMIGIPQEQILHIAQSIFHDIVPANSIGLDNVWVNRRRHVDGFGATPPAHAQPNLEVHDLTALVNMSGLAE